MLWRLAVMWRGGGTCRPAPVRQFRRDGDARTSKRHESPTADRDQHAGGGPMTLQPGQRLGRYELLHPAGHGGMATVWMARLTGTRGFQKPVAIKTMLPSIREDPDAEKMFLSEAAVASRIRHPDVVEILDLGEEQGVLYLVMEWIHGEPLGVVLAAAAKRGGMPLSLAVRIGAQTCAALHAAHELTDDAGNPLGLVHRDVSPHNVLAGFDGVIKLVDFGIAKVTSEATHLTEMGMVRGKIPYMAPEQIRFEKLDRRTDVFAAGIRSSEASATRRRSPSATTIRWRSPRASFRATRSGSSASSSRPSRRTP